MKSSTNLAICQPATSISWSGSMPNVGSASASARCSATEEIVRTWSQRTTGQVT